MPQAIALGYEVVHATTGRLRIRIPQLAIDPEYASKLHWVLKSSVQVLNARFNLAVSCLIVDYEADQVAPATMQAYLVAAIQWAFVAETPPAYQLELELAAEVDYLERLGLPLLSLGVAMLTEALGLFPPFLVGGLIFIAAIPLFKTTFQAILHERKLTLNVLESLWTILHTLEGQLVAPALALNLDELGIVMRDNTARKTRRQALDFKLEGLYVRVKREGKEQQILLEEVQIADLVIVYPGDVIPVDGRVVKGKATIDQHQLTGESRLVACREGQKVYASTMVVEGRLGILAERTGKNTRAGLVVELLKQAPVYDTRITDFAEQAADLTIAPTLALSGTLFALTGNIHQSIALLQLDFGTGIRISSATAILTALNSAARSGVYIRCGHALEVLSRLDTVLFDKTGTLTLGCAEVVDIQTVDEQIAPLEVLRLAAAAERGLTHPTAQAIVRYAEKCGVQTQLPWEWWDYKIGKGVIAQLNGQRILLGSNRFLQKEGVDLKPIHRKYPDLKQSGHTHVYLAQESKLLGLISLTIPIRPESAYVIAALEQQGIQTYMLTGDHAKASSKVAMKLGILPDRVYAEVFPEKKVEILRELEAEGKTVAYVGEGVNDAAALAYADVSISLAEGSQVARQTADVVLMNNDLRGLIQAIAIAKQAMAIVHQNIGLVAVPNISVVLGGVFLGLDPVFAVFINSGAMILAELNGLRPLVEDFDQGNL